jgi:hypothetical protein
MDIQTQGIDINTIHGHYSYTVVGIGEGNVHLDAVIPVTICIP